MLSCTSRLRVIHLNINWEEGQAERSCQQCLLPNAANSQQNPRLTTNQIALPGHQSRSSSPARSWPRLPQHLTVRRMCKQNNLMREFSGTCLLPTAEETEVTAARAPTADRVEPPQPNNESRLLPEEALLLTTGPGALASASLSSSLLNCSRLASTLISACKFNDRRHSYARYCIFCIF